MTDWPVMSDEQIIQSINDGRRRNKRDGRDGVLVSASSEYMRDHRYAIQAQAKHTGELAEAVIVWMCYFAQRQEIMMREALKAIIAEGTRSLEQGEHLVREVYDIDGVDRLARQALRGDKGE